MEMIDGGESDYKVIGVPVDDKRWEDVHDLGDINKHTIKEYVHFFENYKELKKGEKGIVTIPKISGKAEALEAVQKSIKLYEEKFSK